MASMRTLRMACAVSSGAERNPYAKAPVGRLDGRSGDRAVRAEQQSQLPRAQGGPTYPGGERGGLWPEEKVKGKRHQPEGWSEHITSGQTRMQTFQMLDGHPLGCAEQPGMPGRHEAVGEGERGHEEADAQGKHPNQLGATSRANSRQGAVPDNSAHARHIWAANSDYGEAPPKQPIRAGICTGDTLCGATDDTRAFCGGQDKCGDEGSTLPELVFAGAEGLLGETARTCRTMGRPVPATLQRWRPEVLRGGDALSR